ncbi:short-chain dehydrogenase [Nostoc sp. 3335mG]|nr:short-chain dehydrogenase [Nostoc sp. 3335mG]
MGRVEGKVALVTGGGSGLGAADSEALAREGATVVVADVNLGPAEAVAARIGNGAVAMLLDVTSEDAWIDAMKTIADKFGRLDILVNNAGIVLTADVEHSTLEDYRRANAVMNEGVFLGCKHAIPLMNRNDGGSIVNISSIGAWLGYPDIIAYAAAKAAVRGISKSVAVMCQERGYKIRCNTVLPGTIETPMVQKFEQRVGVTHEVPDGILPHDAAGHPRDIAAMVLFLASDESRFITGAEMIVDNGVTVRPF